MYVFAQREGKRNREREREIERSRDGLPVAAVRVAHPLEVTHPALGVGVSAAGPPNLGSSLTPAGSSWMSA